MKLLLYFFLAHLIRFSHSQNKHSSSEYELIDRELVAGGKRGGVPIDYQVLIQHDGSFVCGGVLIASDVVLTSAVNCAASSLASYEIHVGVYDRTQDPPMVRSVVQEERHPDYDPLDFVGAKNDVMLLKLNESVTDYNPVVLNEDPAIPAVNEFVVVTGWGVEELNGQFSDVLLSTQVQIISTEICEESLVSFLGVDGEIGDGGVCSYTPYRGACDGDYGGPIVIQNFNGAPLLVGMSAWGMDCNDFIFPKVNMRISFYLDWIQSSMCSAFDGSGKYDFCDDVDATSVLPTKSPTMSPTKSPTKSPTMSPTKSPTKSPTSLSTTFPSKSPIILLTKSPTKSPSFTPSKRILTAFPTKSPSATPTIRPTKSPTISPTKLPTSLPSKKPTAILSKSPTKIPTKPPTLSPLKIPTSLPSEKPTRTPSVSSTKSPTTIEMTSSKPTSELENTIDLAKDPPALTPVIASGFHSGSSSRLIRLFQFFTMIYAYNNFV